MIDCHIGYHLSAYLIGNKNNIKNSGFIVINILIYQPALYIFRAASSPVLIAPSINPCQSARCSPAKWVWR